MKRVVKWTGAILLVAVVAALAFAPAWVESRQNRLSLPPPYSASPQATELARRLLTADLHADSLLWDRNLLRRGTRGHVDVPRLVEGNVALQAFTVVTKVPAGLNIERNPSDSDLITRLAVAQLWPPRTWRSLRERALYQARKLEEFAADSAGRLVLIRTREDLRNFLERRARQPGIVAGFLGAEGAQPLEGKIENLDALFDAGFRMMAPTHFFDNDVGGSAHGITKCGLTAFGREVIHRMEAKRMIVDLAHASSQTFDEVLALATRPVVVSHTGVKGTCDNTRNLSDEQLRGVARTGGVVGIGFWPTAVCGNDTRAIARAIRHAVSVAGVDHVALGSDFDGSVTMPFDASGMAQLVEALLAEGFTEDEIRKVMGGNTLRVLCEILP